MSASLLSHRQQASSSYGTLDDSSVSPAQSAMMSATKVIVDADLNPDSDASFEASDEAEAIFQRRIRLKVDFRLCTIAGILCSLNLLDSGVLSSASVTSMLSDLDLDRGNRFSVAIFIFTVASIAFQLPSTIAVRTFGPRRWFSLITCCFGLITLCSGFIHTWKQMIALRVLLGASMAGIYPGLGYLISTWYEHPTLARF